MARKRMIDPQIWESAYDKHWTPDDFTVMVAAISAADDEGRGRLSIIKRNCGEMISERKLKKVLENLHDSIRIYGKIYFFLPNFLEYQTINHPKGSKLPDPNTFNNNDLSKNSTVSSTVIDTEFGATSEVKLSKVKISEVKGTETFFSEVHFKKIKDLYVKCSNISDPNTTTHIQPVLKFYEHIPEHLTEEHITKCITEAFKGINKNKGVRIDYLLGNIQAKITAKHEEILNDLKKPVLDQADKDRKKTKTSEKTESDDYAVDKAREYNEFFKNNSGLFSEKEKNELLFLLQKQNIIQAGAIIEPKMENAPL